MRENIIINMSTCVKSVCWGVAIELRMRDSLLMVVYIYSV